MKKITLLFASTLLLFVACKNNTTPTNTTATTTVSTTPAHTEPPPPPTQFCYLMTEGRDSTFVTLKVNDGKVTGEMTWQPYEEHGATGTLSGVKNAADELDLIYNYTIEGSEQSETKIMKMDNEKLMIKNGQLIDPKNDGNLKYKDVAKAKYTETLLRVSCK